MEKQLRAMRVIQRALETLTPEEASNVLSFVVNSYRQTPRPTQAHEEMMNQKTPTPAKENK